MIVGINGEIGSGKDTVGTIMQYISAKYKGELLPHQDNFDTFKLAPFANAIQSGWEIKKFAGKLKQIASLLTGIPVEKFEDQEFKNTTLSKEWANSNSLTLDERDPMTVREFLQRLGTDAVRNGLHNNTWVNALMADYKAVQYHDGGKFYDKGEYPNWIVTDCRFPNEAQSIKDRGGLVIQVLRPSIGTTEIKHISEIALANWDFDYHIINDGTIEELIRKVKIMMIKFNLID